MIEFIVWLVSVFGLLLFGALIHAARVVDECNVTDPYEAIKLVVDGLKWPLLLVGQSIVWATSLTHRHRFESVSVGLRWGALDNDRRPQCRCGARKPSPTLQPPGEPPEPPSPPPPKK